MTNMDIKDINQLKDFLKWRKEEPEQYKEFMKDLKEFFGEFQELLR